MPGNMIKRSGIIISLIMIFLSVSHSDAKGADAKEKIKWNKDQPIQIVSDRLDAYNEKKLVVFSGNAVATQGDKVIKADRLFLYYKKDSRATEKAGTQDIGSAGDLEKIEAKGHVTITQGERVVTGDDAIFYQDAQKIIMVGNAVMRDGRNIINGDRIVVFLDEDRGVIESVKKAGSRPQYIPRTRKTKRNETAVEKV